MCKIHANQVLAEDQVKRPIGHCMADILLKEGNHVAYFPVQAIFPVYFPE